MPSKVTDVCCSIDSYFHPALISRLLLLRQILSFSTCVTLSRQGCPGKYHNDAKCYFKPQSWYKLKLVNNDNNAIAEQHMNIVRLNS